MERNTNFLSELEAELESDFSSDARHSNELELESDNEFELESGSDNEFEMESDSDGEFELETDNESDNEFELDSESDNEFEFEYDGSTVRNFESRIGQLLSRSGDNELEFDQELNQVIHDMEREFFFKGLKKLARKGLKKFQSIAGRTPLGQVVNTATSLARGNIRNALRKAASLALRYGSGFVPGGAALSPIAARALNLEMGEERETPIQKARSLVQLAKNAYQGVAKQLDPRMANRNTANAIAQAAIQKAMSVVQSGPTHGRSKKNVVIKISAAAWNKVKNGGHIILKLQ